MEVNRRYWDSLVPVHAASRFYDVSGFLAGGSSLLARISILTLVRRQYTPALPEHHVFPR